MHARVLASFGITDVATLLSSAAGQKYVDVIQALNEENAQGLNETDVHKHVKTIVKLFQGDGSKKENRSIATHGCQRRE